jgi:hypothetical protein
MSRRSRLTKLEPLGAVIQRDPGLRVPASVETSPIAYRDWEEAVGSRIAARARPVRIDRGVLVVRAATSTWAQELSMLSEVILAKLRARGVVLESLRFRVGPVALPERPPSRDEVRQEPPAVPLPADVRVELSRVEDAELRDAIARAAAKNLGWQLANGRTLQKRDDAAPTGARATDDRAGPQPPVTSAQSGVRAPRSAGTGSAPRGRRSARAPSGSRGKT